MNKAILQIGLLAFCVSAVVFGTRNDALLDIVLRSFIVFVAVVIAMALVLAISATVVDRRRGKHQDVEPAGAKPVQPEPQSSKQ